MVWLSVVGFGVIGVSLRFAIDSWIANWAFSFPIGTLLINILGSLAAGFVYRYGFEQEQLSLTLRLGLLIGFCGGFTTFSGFALQLVQQLQAGRFAPALIYSAGSPILCIFAAYGGIFLARLFDTAAS